MAIGKLFTALLKGTINEFPFPLSTVLTYLLDEVSEGHDTIARLELKIAGVDQKIEQHILAPYRTGTVYLEEAQHASAKSSQQRFLREAQKKFIDASQIDLPQYPALPIKGCFYVGVCHDLLADKRNARRWYEKSHRLIVSYIRSHDRSPLRLEREQRIASLKEQLSILRKKQEELKYQRVLFRRALGAREQEAKVFEQLVEEHQQKEKQRTAEQKRVIAKKLAVLESSPSLDDLLDPAQYQPQLRHRQFGELADQKYFLGWDINRQQPEAICAWALDLTALLASRPAKTKGLKSP